MKQTGMSRWGLAILAVLSGGTAAAQTPDQQVDPRRITPVVEVVQDVRDSIVNISATGVVQVRSPDPFFDLFWGPRRQEVNSVGSGFVLHESGYLVTNAHVVDRTIDLRVTFANGKEYKATVVVSDPEHDLAIIKIDADHKLKPIPLGRSDDLMPGETVIAIGNPLGYSNTVTTGVVSAIHRQVEASDSIYEDLIQTDASINPGSSGGPLLNILGELIGINTAIRPGAENIGFAIPSDQLRSLVPYMLDFAIAEGRRIRLGMRIEGSESPRVMEVEADSPALAAGIDVGDVLVSVDGKPLRRDIDFYIAMLGREVGDKVVIDLRRNGKDREVTLTLVERPQPNGAQLAREKLGITVEDLTPSAAKMFGVRAQVGVLIMEVERRGPADRAEVEPGDLIVRIGRHRVNTLEDLAAVLEDVQPRTVVPVTLWRISGNTVYEFSGVRLSAR